MTPRLLLMEPPFYRLMEGGYGLTRYPLGLGYLAAAVRAATDWEVTAYNGDFVPRAAPFRVTYLTGQGFAKYQANLADPQAPPWQEARRVLASCRPGVVGLSLKSPTLAAGLALARLAKELDPGVLVVAGGPHVTAVGPAVLRHPELDMAVLGEGEATLVELLRAWEQGRDPAQVAGLALRRGGELVATATRAPLRDLDSLPWPRPAANQALWDYRRYPASAFRGLLASRGCPRGCSYCGSRRIWGGVRRRRPAAVAAEARSLWEQRVGPLHFEDDTFGVDAAHLPDLCQGLAQGCPGLAFTCETHVSLVTPQALDSLQKAGCLGIQLGIESGDDRVLKTMRKGFCIRQALEACRLIRERGLRLECFFMVGLPQEDESSLGRTLRVIQALDCDKVIYSIFTPYPGTEAFAHCQRRGLIGPGFDPSLHNHQSPANCFSQHIAPTRFRELAAQVEEAVEIKNAGRRPLAEPEP
ncbi:MAG: B12-binding domain-containing radical SAM protein [Desulfarculus sp.]|nr:B12-binding domain-containing radical SAM protein [Desulfarculus sp.]